MSLDWNRPYGIVYGAESGHRYEQDGRLFDGDGYPVEAANPARIKTPRRAAPRGSLFNDAEEGCAPGPDEPNGGLEYRIAEDGEEVIL